MGAWKYLEMIDEWWITLMVQVLAEFFFSEDNDRVPLCNIVVAKPRGVQTPPIATSLSFQFNCQWRIIREYHNLASFRLRAWNPSRRRDKLSIRIIWSEDVNVWAVVSHQNYHSFQYRNILTSGVWWCYRRLHWLVNAPRRIIPLVLLF